MVDSLVGGVGSSKVAKGHQPVQQDVNESSVETASHISSLERKIQERKVIKRELLENRPMIKIAVRRKAATTSNASTLSKSKLLEPIVKCKVNMFTNLSELYNSLVPLSTVRPVTMLHLGPPKYSDKKFSCIFSDPFHRSSQSDSQVREMRIIDDSITNLSQISRNALRIANSANANVPTFNSIDTAITSSFGIKNYTFIRITRASSLDNDHSILLKLDTAHPGDHWLVDDTFDREDLEFVGDENDIISNTFLKKVIARPRFKTDMKFFIIPGSLNASLYVDKRMLERDLINGVVDLENCDRVILCAFDFEQTLEDFGKLALLNDSSHDMSDNPYYWKSKKFCSFVNYMKRKRTDFVDVGVQDVGSDVKQEYKTNYQPPVPERIAYPDYVIKLSKMNKQPTLLPAIAPHYDPDVIPPVHVKHPTISPRSPSTELNNIHNPATSYFGSNPYIINKTHFEHTPMSKKNSDCEPPLSYQAYNMLRDSTSGQESSSQDLPSFKTNFVPMLPSLSNIVPDRYCRSKVVTPPPSKHHPHDYSHHFLPAWK